MSVFVLDASVTVAWCFSDQRTALTDHVLGELESGFAVVPSLWALEVGNVLAVSERKRYLTGPQIEAFLADLADLPKQIEHQVHEIAFGRTLELAREHRLSTYDASYLELAERMGLPLATLDAELRKAARKVGVELVEAP